MSVDEDDLRALATDHFLSEGLGGKLSRDASNIISAFVDGFPISRKRFAPILGCGYILERVFWLELGQRLACFKQGIAPLSTAEKDFLRQHSDLLLRHPWPGDFARVLDLLLSSEIPSDASFFSDQLIDRELPRSSTVVRSAFQSAHTISENLTDGLITIFFCVLHDGDFQDFTRQLPSPQDVFNAMRSDEFRGVPNFERLDRREAAIAGFIRYTEFLSAMDSLFPFTSRVKPTTGSSPTPKEKLLRAIFPQQVDEETILDDRKDRKLLAEAVTGIIEWRIPKSDRALTTYSAVQAGFLKMAFQEFLKYPSSGLYWPIEETERQLTRLSFKFFGVYIRRVHENMLTSKDIRTEFMEEIESLRETERKPGGSGEPATEK